jgi:hypothetical protein
MLVNAVLLRVVCVRLHTESLCKYALFSFQIEFGLAMVLSSRVCVQQTKTLDGNINSILHVFDRLLQPSRMSALAVSG